MDYMILAHSELGLEVLDPRGLWSLGFKTERWTSSFSRIFIIFSVEKKKKKKHGYAPLSGSGTTLAA
jgi:hypothetical protein